MLRFVSPLRSHGFCGLRAEFLTGLLGASLLLFGGCGGRTLSTIEVTPGAPNIFVGATVQLTATAHYSDQSTADVSSTVFWTTPTITDAQIASASSAGLVTGHEPGNSRISASISIGAQGQPTGAQAVVTLTVTAPHPSPSSQTSLHH